MSIYIYIFVYTYIYILLVFFIYPYTLVFLDHIWYRLGRCRFARTYQGFARTYWVKLNEHTGTEVHKINDHAWISQNYFERL